MLEHALTPGDETLLAARLVDLDLSILFMLALFLVFAFLLTRFITKPLMQSQSERHVSMEGAREAASSAELIAAETRLAYEAKLTEARQGAVEVRDAIRDEANAAARATVESVRAETEAQTSSASAEITAAAARARAEMKAHVDALAADLAKKLITQAGGKA